MNDDNFFLKIRNFAKENSERDDIHGLAHIERVYNTCIQFGRRLGASLRVLTVSALLHDIGRINEKNNPKRGNHAEISAIMALEFLSSNNFDLSREEINNISHSIKAHSFSNNIVPKTIEAKILSDADKLDAIGAIGLYRTISHTIICKGGLNEVIEHLENKIMKLNDKLYLNFSKKIAKKRQKIILNFYNEIKKF